MILNRRSCRSFSDAPISDSDINTILEAGRFAPSTVNLQTWSFITFTDAHWRETFGRPVPFKAPAAIVICADINRLQELMPEMLETPALNLSFAVFNAGLAAQNMTLAAEALGLRSVMLSETGRTGLLDFAFLREKLHLPAGVLPLTTLVIGHAESSLPGIPPRQPREAVVMETTYDNTSGSKLKDWFQQMFIGYKITHPLSSFDKQLEHYRSKMADAEHEIHKEFDKK